MGSMSGVLIRRIGTGAATKTPHEQEFHVHWFGEASFSLPCANIQRKRHE